MYPCHLMCRILTQSHQHCKRTMIVGPVGWGSNRFFVGKLQGLNTPYNFVHVPTDAGRIVQREHELVFGVDDKDRAARQKNNKVEMLSNSQPDF